MEQLINFRKGINKNLTNYDAYNLINYANDTNLQNILIIIFNTRDIKYGEGLKKTSILLLLELYFKYPNIIHFFNLLPNKYGCWQDINIIIDHLLTCKKEYNDIWYDGHLDIHELDNRRPLLNKCIKYLVNMTISQLILDSTSDKLSQCSKWIPREGKRYWNVGKIYALRLFPAKTDNEKYSSYKKYGRLIKNISNKLNITEKLMCSNQWNNIEPANCPNKCTFKYRRALYNYNNNPHRLECGEKFRNKEKKKCDNIFRKLVSNYIPDIPHFKQITEQSIKYDTMWRNNIDELRINNTPLNVYIIPDTSLSMWKKKDGTRFIDKCLTISMTSYDLCDGENRMMSFSHNPKWIKLSKRYGLHEKINKVLHSGWGNKICIYNALELILEQWINEHKTHEQTKDTEVLILSDRLFDNSVIDIWLNHSYKQLNKKFIDNGYTLPKIVYWDLKGTYNNNKVGINFRYGYSDKICMDYIENNTETYKINKILNSKHYDIIKEYDNEDDFILL